MGFNENICILIWPLIIILPFLLTINDNYIKIFPSSWYVNSVPVNVQKGIWPSPLGLTLGILAVAVGQAIVLLFFIFRRNGLLGKTVLIQREDKKYDINEGLITHLAQPEGFLMLGLYLSCYWMFGLMPSSYYSFSGGIDIKHVVIQLLLQDCIQYLMHLIEHKAHPLLYQASHKPHHRFTNPRLFDAFNGSPGDTFLMILVPLIITSRIVNTNVWSYMTFGTLYANWLTLIHSEFAHPWDQMFRIFGIYNIIYHYTSIISIISQLYA